ncbi:MAG TPA: hypothetical protein DCE71_01110 [Parachlamydiales bacterium]|nr:hypothetical protein [Parachlamydiales bacterium]
MSLGLDNNNVASSGREKFEKAADVDFWYCLASNTPLTEAVSLDPCMHKVNEAAVKQLKACPVCNGPANVYHVDSWARQATESFLSLNVEKISSEIRAKDPLERPRLNKVPYPGEKQRFGFNAQNVADRWYPGGHMDFARSLVFVTDDSQEWFTYIDFKGNFDGSLQLKLAWETKDSRVIYSYFRALGIDVEACSGWSIIFEHIDEIREVYAILRENHEFSPVWTDWLDKVIEAGDWRKVT